MSLARPSVAGLARGVDTVAALDAGTIAGTANQDTLAALSLSLTGTTGGSGGYTYAWVVVDPMRRDRSSNVLDDATLAAPTLTPELHSGMWCISVTVTDGAGSTDTANVTFRLGDADGWIRLRDSDLTWDVTNSIIAAHAQNGNSIRLTINDTQSTTPSASDHGSYQLLVDSSDLFVQGRMTLDSAGNAGDENWAGIGVYNSVSAFANAGCGACIHLDAATPAQRAKWLTGNSQSPDATDRATATDAVAAPLIRQGTSSLAGLFVQTTAGVKLEETSYSVEVDYSSACYVILFEGRQVTGAGQTTIDVTPYARAGYFGS